MRLCIADPPYLGRAAIWYGGAMTAAQQTKRRHQSTTTTTTVRRADAHPDSARWDDVAAHNELVDTLIESYDGWAIALAHNNLRDYFHIIPEREPIRVGIWHKTQNLPGGARVVNAWEPVIVRIPDGRMSSVGQMTMRDHLTSKVLNNGFPGAKPPAWTRWVLDMLGYDPAIDTVEDMFPGSGAVTNEIAQGVLL